MNSTKNEKNRMEDEEDIQRNIPTKAPRGFSYLRGPDNVPVLVPTYLVPATEHALEVDKTCKTLNVSSATPGPRAGLDESYQGIAGDEVEIPSDPPLCDREMLKLHAEVISLQRTLGLSYKDAAHRLYFTEVSKIQTEKSAETAFSGIRENIDNTIINEIFPVLTKLESGDL